MNRSIFRVLALAVLVGASGFATSAEAGLFKNLLTKVDTAMRNVNTNYWQGENSLGNTVIKAVKGEKGNFFQAFDAIHQAQVTAQNQALADVKAIWEAIKDIVLWLPRKLKEMAEKVINKLNGMNQGATVKERWNNLVNAGGSAGARVQSFSNPTPASEPEPAGEESGSIENDLSAYLSDDPGALGSVDREELIARLETSARASADAPAAPSSETYGAEGFGELMEMSLTIEDKPKKSEARKRIRYAYLSSLDTALKQGELPKAGAIIRTGKDLYVGNPDGMEKAMGMIAKRHPKHAAAITKAAKRISNLARTGR